MSKSKKSESEKTLDGMLSDLRTMLKGEQDKEMKLKISDRILKALAVSRAFKNDGFGKGFDMGAEDDEGAA